MSHEYLLERQDIKRVPCHPGVILGKDVLPALRLTVTGGAAKLRVSRQTLHRIIAGRASITPEMAVRLGKLCGTGPGLWLRMQQAHDLRLAEKRLKSELAKIPTINAAA